MFEIIEVTRNWFTQSIKLKALDDMSTKRPSLYNPERHYKYKAGEVLTVKFPLRDKLAVGDKLSLNNVVNINDLIPSRYGF